MPVNMGTTNSGTPLMNVCRMDSRDAGKLVKVLVQKLGADPTLRDYRGLAPVDFAVESGTTEAQKYVERTAHTYKAPTPGADKVTVMPATADTKTDCQQENCFAHSTCRGKLTLTGLPLDVIGLRERQDWLVGDAMSELACQGALPALQRHLAFACDEFWQTRWAKMSLYVAAAVAAKKGHSEFVLYLCKERGVAVNLITYPILHEVLTPLVNAIAYGSEDLALELLALSGQDLDLERHVSPIKGTLLHLATLAEKEGVVKKLLTTYGASLDALDAGNNSAVALAARCCQVPELRVLLQEYQARGRLHEALERSCLSDKGVHHSLLFACLDKFQIEEPMRLATTRLLMEEFNANSRAVQKHADYLVLPLHASASHGLLSIVKLYISECGVPVDQPTSGKQVLTPLHCTAMCEFAHDAEDEEKMVRTVAFLVEEHGASFSQQTDRGLTAAQVAGRRGKTRVASYLRRMERDQAKMVELTAGQDATKAAEAAEEAANELLAELEAEEAAIRGCGGGGGKISKKSGKGKGKKKM